MTQKYGVSVVPSVESVRLAYESRVGCTSYPQALVIEAARNVITSLRQRLMAGDSDVPIGKDGKADGIWLSSQLDIELTRMLTPSLRPVVNGTGVVVHTNLGRAPLGEKALQHIANCAKGYSNLEFDLNQGRRGSRFSHVERLMCALTRAEACLVVNNNASALLLVLTALARGREVVVSRSELIEIGGAFRLPDIMAVGGARLREVGTTNRTRISDFEAALGPETGLIMKAHRSNFQLDGYVQDPEREELVKLSKANNVPFYEDLGSGLMVSLPKGLGGEQLVQESVRSGCDLVSFSGDKLLGGPQAGIIVGTSKLVRRLERHPLSRALRPDKMTLAGLESVCVSYLMSTHVRDIPVLGMLNMTEADLEAKARHLAVKLARPRLLSVAVRVDSRVGGGALPAATVPSWAVSLHHDSLGSADLSRRLRNANPSVVGRIENDVLLLDVRTLGEDDGDAIVSALSQALED